VDAGGRTSGACEAAARDQTGEEGGGGGRRRRNETRRHGDEFGVRLSHDSIRDGSCRLLHLFSVAGPSGGPVGQNIVQCDCPFSSFFPNKKWQCFAT
jgi:hypothetical protein